MVQRTGMPCVVMFIEVCGAAELFEALGNARAQLAIASLLQTLTDTVDRHAGRTIKTIGPQIMCVFPAVRQAAAMAADAQHAARAAIQALATGALAVRVGFQYGPVINQDADVFGDAVNVAARILSHAKPGQILLSSETARGLQHAGIDMRLVGNTHVKGKAQPIDLMELIWERENLTKANARLEVKSEDARLIARFGDDTIELNRSKPTLQMGRADGNDFVVSGTLVSRIHARIELRRSNFYLVDQSSNGTFLCARGQPEITLRRDEAVLDASGLISLGTPTAEARNLCLEFTVHKRP
jgi:class 3 adenylate cyclase